MKKVIVISLSVLMIFSVFLIPVSAAGILNYPSTWAEFEKKIDKLPAIYQDAYSVTYFLDSFIIYFDDSRINEDGSAVMNAVLWDSLKQDVTGEHDNSLFNTLTASDISDDYDYDGFHNYIYNVDSGEWEYDFTFSTTFQMPVGYEIYSFNTIYYTDDSSSVFYSKGVFPGFAEVLESDPNYSGGSPNEDEDKAEEGILAWLTNFFGNFGEMLAGLFVPDDDYFEGVVNRFKSKVPFVYVVIDFIDSLGEFFSETDFEEPPVISVDLSAAEGKYDWGVSANALDMSWYARYKPYCDMFLASFMWLSYLWLLYKRLPDIISGAGMVTEGAIGYTKYETTAKWYRGRSRK